MKPKKKDKVVPKKKRGARGPESPYDPKFHPGYAKMLASRGATIAEFADACGVNDRTIRRWFVNYPELSDAFRFAASAYDNRIERAMAERAMGYEFEDEEIKVVNGEVLHVPVHRHLPPDVGAGMNYLTNRMPHQYKRIVDVKHTEAKIESSEVIIEEIQTKILRLAMKYQVALPGLNLEGKQNDGGEEGNTGAGSSDT